MNPRDERARVRRIMRRGMPTSGYLRGRPEQGLLFLCYNADLESQFEFVQHQWLNAGVEAHGLSVDRDPIAGDPAPAGAENSGATFNFTWAHDARPYTVSGLHSHVHARWGEYFLMPSRSTFAELSADSRSPIAEFNARVKYEPDLVLRRDILGRWLDDPEMCRRIFAEVRALGGAVRLDGEQVVLAGSKNAVATVVHDGGARFSVARQGMAMRQTTGAFYLGMDPNTREYQLDSAASEIIAAWTPSSEAELAKELAAIGADAAELCLTFFKLSLTDAVARHTGAGLPARGRLDLEDFTAFVVAGMTPKLFGVPQPSAAGTFQLNVPHSGYLFFAFPEAKFLEFADQAARGLGMYLSQLFVERDRRERRELFPEAADRVGSEELAQAYVPQGQDPDDRWQVKLNSTLSQLEQVFARQGRVCALEDKVRLLAGIVSGLLITSFKLFTDGVSEYAKRFPPGSEVVVDPEQAARLPFATMKQRERSMPNIIYRRAIVAGALGPAQVQAGDVVLASQGSAMAESGDDWFFGDCTPAAGMLARSPHFCPGHRVATALLETMSRLLFTGLADLRVEDDTGTSFSYDWAKLAAELAAVARSQPGASV
jgi:hypothetical protein